MNYRDILPHIPPELPYQDWLAVGMALHHEGGSCAEWDAWSAQDTRPKQYRPGACAEKWRGFGHANGPVTIGTLYELAKRHGYKPMGGAPHVKARAYDWDDVIPVVDLEWTEDDESIEAPAQDWNPVQEVIDYLRALFQAEEHVSYVFEASEDGKPAGRGVYSCTMGQLVDDLQRHRDIGRAMGDYHAEAGGWVRINPVDGQGIADKNVTAYRHALIESDSESIERQQAIYSQLELPLAALVHSGGKSLHAIVRIDAATREEYRERVNYLHQVCAKNGLTIDGANKNPSRLSRLPGILRNGNPQFLVGVKLGKPSWDAWKTWIEELDDDLPDIERLADLWDTPPLLADEIIQGVLRRGHKMLLAGPSKAGKSFALLELAIAIAEGADWLGWPCAKGRVLYLNLELDAASCLRRIRDLYSALGRKPSGGAEFHLWHLRGKATPLDRLVPKLLRRARATHYDAIIIDPIYKVSTGDENDAHSVGEFCNQLDRIALELNAAVIYCHHHSKDSQGQKNALDRSSGSGVFARDADAILDLLELRIEDDRRATLEGRACCRAIAAMLDADPDADGWQTAIAQDIQVVAAPFEAEARKLLCSASALATLDASLDAAKAAVACLSGWRIEGTLREFAPIKPKNLFFRYPIHVLDADDALADAKADGEEAPWAAQQREKRAAQNKERQSDLQALQTAWAALAGWEGGEDVYLGDLCEATGKTEAQIRRTINKRKVKPYIIGPDNIMRTPQQDKEFRFVAAYEKTKDMHGLAHKTAMAKAMKVDERSVRRYIKDIPGYKLEDGFILKLETEEGNGE